MRKKYSSYSTGIVPQEKETGTLVKKVMNSKFGRIATGATVGIYFLTTAGCSTLKENYTINGQRLDKKYAESGQIATDAGSEQKKWYQTKKGKVAIVLGLGLLGWGLYELTDDDDDPTPAPGGSGGSG